MTPGAYLTGIYQALLTIKLSFMRISLLLLCLWIGAAVPAQTFRWNDNTSAKTPEAAPKDALADETGYAIYYADYLDGNPTALGEIYHQDLMTAGHKKLPLGTIVKVTRLDNGLSTTVRINDRGGYGEECVIDLSKAAAAQIDLLRVGRTRVKLTVMGYSNNNPPASANSQTVARTEPQLTARSVAQPAAYAYEPTPAPSKNSGLTVKTVPPPATTKPASYSNDNQPALQARSIPQPTVKQGLDEVAILANPVNGFAVQLGSYNEFSNAERHVVTLQHKGFNSLFVLQEKRADGATINRVIAAPFTSVSDAQNYLEELRQYHQMEGLVVQLR
jgi:rare lipoprotein A